MEFPKPAWWQDYCAADAWGEGLKHGKSTTDLSCRQIHYYDDEDLLIYNSDGPVEEEEYATGWHKHFLEDEAKGRQQGDPGSAMRKMWEQALHNSSCLALS